MAIIYNPEIRQFHLKGHDISYVFRVMENDQLEQLYHGSPLPTNVDLTYLAERGHRDMQASPFWENPDFSLEHIRQEYPAPNIGDYRTCAFELERADGSRVFNFRYRTHRITEGKPGIPGLPATYVEDPAEAETLEIELEDSVSGVTLILYYTVFRDYPVVARHARFIGGKDTVTIRSAMSLSIDYPDKDYEMIDLAGTWARERAVRRRPLDYGCQSVYSLRGCSSHQFNPFIALVRKNTTENAGEAIGLSLIYSGDFLAEAEVDNFDITRLRIGIHPQEFSWTLEAGASFDTPEAVLAYSRDGMGGMSRAFHALYRTRLARGYWRDRPRPILLNNWEATYFDFTEDKILSMAALAKDLGVELFVLDDGWFGKRNSSQSSLGDWYPNLDKIPSGIDGLSHKIAAMGLRFGLWIEPEMINEDSDLYRSHPEWVLGDKRHPLCYARNQLVLDFSKDEVVDYLFQMLSHLIDSAEISYIKWDLNRSLSEVFSEGNNASWQRETRHRYILGVYRLYQMLTDRYPQILFESCASGGARFDPGMLYYAPQAWTSDDTDAVERIKIQYGTSMVYPVSSMGAHVSVVPNEQLGRCESLRMRAAVAMFGTFGYELDITRFTPEERDEVMQQIVMMKQYRELIQFGTLYRLQSPFEGDGNEAAWMVLAPDGSRALLAYYRILQRPEAKYRRLRLQGLQPETRYEVEEILLPEEPVTGVYSGAELTQAGLVMSDTYSGVKGRLASIRGDYMARVWEIRAEK